MSRSTAQAGQKRDQLQQLAGVVAARVRLGRGDRADRQDVFQEALLEGLKARRAATKINKPTSSDILLRRMTQAVYRMLHRGQGDLLEADF